VSAEKKAEVFKKSSELNFKKGAYEMAQADYQKYTLEKDKIIEAKEQELNQLIAILQGQSKIDLIEKDVAYEEKEADYLEDQLFTQRIIIGLLSLLLLAALAAFYFILKNVKARRQANQLLLLKSLRTQMNPHFIFNALNSVNNFISKNDERSANKFLTDFSKLMRLVLNHSQKDFIALEEELNLIELYLKLEHLRFRDKFDFDFKKETTLSAVDLQIPPMLIQPFIENAIWHGLRYKTEKGQLNVSVQKEGKTILVTIKDNGIGRQKSQALKTINQKNYQSEGLKNVGKRLELINQIYGKNYQISIADANPTETEPGTIVHLKIPTDT
jgi:LytS/YehU family sensor histidine kinase